MIDCISGATASCRSRDQFAGDLLRFLWFVLGQRLAQRLSIFGQVGSVVLPPLFASQPAAAAEQGWGLDRWRSGDDEINVAADSEIGTALGDNLAGRNYDQISIRADREVTAGTRRHDRRK